jgi:hypothetical protein
MSNEHKGRTQEEIIHELHELIHDIEHEQHLKQPKSVKK